MEVETFRRRILKGGDVSGENLRKGETFGEKKSRYTQGLVPGIRVAVHLQDVIELAVVSPVLS